MATFLIPAEITRIANNFAGSMPGSSIPALLQELAALENAFALLAYTGRTGAGVCTLTGANVGDKVVGIVNITDGTTAASDFEATITVANQIQQSAVGDLSTKKFAVLLVKKS